MRLIEAQGIIKYGGWYNLIKVKVFRNRNFLENFNFFGFWISNKLKLNWLAKGVSSDAFTICDERIYIYINIYIYLCMYVCMYMYLCM